MERSSRRSHRESSKTRLWHSLGSSSKSKKKSKTHDRSPTASLASSSPPSSSSETRYHSSSKHWDSRRSSRTQHDEEGSSGHRERRPRKRVKTGCDERGYDGGKERTQNFESPEFKYERGISRKSKSSRERYADYDDECDFSHRSHKRYREKTHEKAKNEPESRFSNPRAVISLEEEYERDHRHSSKNMPSSSNHHRSRSKTRHGEDSSGSVEGKHQANLLSSSSSKNYRHKRKHEKDEAIRYGDEERESPLPVRELSQSKAKSTILHAVEDSEDITMDKVVNKLEEQRRDRLSRFEALAAASKAESRAEGNVAGSSSPWASCELSDTVKNTSEESNLPRADSSADYTQAYNRGIEKTLTKGSTEANPSVLTLSPSDSLNKAVCVAAGKGVSAGVDKQAAASSAAGKDLHTGITKQATVSTISSPTHTASPDSGSSSGVSSSRVTAARAAASSPSPSPAASVSSPENVISKSNRFDRFRAFAAELSLGSLKSSTAGSLSSNAKSASSKVVLKLLPASSALGSNQNAELFADKASDLDAGTFLLERLEAEEVSKKSEDVDTLEHYMSELSKEFSIDKEEKGDKPLFLSVPKAISIDEINSWSLHKYKWEKQEASAGNLSSSNLKTSEAANSSSFKNINGSSFKGSSSELQSVASGTSQSAASNGEDPSPSSSLGDEDDYYRKFIETFKSSGDFGANSQRSEDGGGDAVKSPSSHDSGGEKGVCASFLGEDRGGEERFYSTHSTDITRISGHTGNEKLFFSETRMVSKQEYQEGKVKEGLPPSSNSDPGGGGGFRRDSTVTPVAMLDEDDLRMFSDDEVNEEENEPKLGDSYFDLVKKIGQKKELPPVNHSTIEYMPFRKNLYVQVREITLMKDHEVEAFRKTNGNIKVRGKNCPRPVKSFTQCGLPEKCLKLLQRRNYEEPFAIQKQAIPALMSGRDVIGIAETGSGKTLAYVLPMLRHILDQPPLKDGDGPIGLVIAPTRELTVQIYQEVKKFCKAVNLQCIAIYGGTGIGEQLSQLRRGVEVVVGTPGRLIDVLTISGGKVTNLRRVSFTVLDEADRMFDMGFEPQISAIMRNIQPSRQICLFSATFPPHIEALARKILYKPLEIVIGERGRTASRVKQFVEIRSEYEKFFRLLQLLGEWNEYGSIIIFVSRQVEADDIFAELLKYGYQCAVLHGGQDQVDREFTIQDFKEGQKTILIATSIAARGLDVKAVVLVINYKAPDHIEDYVHRIGRTGRAGKFGVAYTFLTSQEGDKAEELVKALRMSEQEVPPSLLELANDFKLKCNMGTAKAFKGKGFGGKGFKFVPSEKSRLQQERSAAKIELGMDEEEDEEYDAIDKMEESKAEESSGGVSASLAAPQALEGGAGESPGDTVTGAAARAKALAEILKKKDGRTEATNAIIAASVDPLTEQLIDQQAESLAQKSLLHVKDLVQRARLVASAKSALKELMMLKRGPQTASSGDASSQSLASGILCHSVPPTLGKVPGLSPFGYLDPVTGNAVDELEINDYPQQARFKITHREVLSRISEASGAICQIKGQYISPEQARTGPQGLKRLYIEIIGRTAISVQRAKHDIHFLMESVSMKQLNASSTQRTVGKYSVL